MGALSGEQIQPARGLTRVFRDKNFYLGLAPKVFRACRCRAPRSPTSCHFGFCFLKELEFCFRSGCSIVKLFHPFGTEKLGKITFIVGFLDLAAFFTALLLSRPARKPHDRFSRLEPDVIFWTLQQSNEDGACLGCARPESFESNRHELFSLAAELVYKCRVPQPSRYHFSAYSGTATAGFKR
jgi:hypothetical protein